jgi:PAS domain S-box-containing protein
MTAGSKTKEQLIQELNEVRQKIAALEKREMERKQAGELFPNSDHFLRMEEALKESENKYKQVVENATDLIFTTDSWGKFTFANSAALKLVGYSLAEIKEFNYLDLILPGHRQRLSEIYTEQFREKKPSVYVEYPFLSKTGEVRWWGQQTTLINKDEKIVGFQSVARDITERKSVEEAWRKSEEEARELARENAVMAELGQILSSTLDLEEVYGRFAEEMGKLIPFNRVTVNAIEDDRTAKILYTSGLPISGREAGNTFPLSESGTEEIMRTRASLLIREENWEAVAVRFPGLSAVMRAGQRSLMLVPLFSKNEVIGSLSIQSDQPNAYSEKDLQLAEKVGTQIAGTIANAQLFAKHKKAEEALRE